MAIKTTCLGLALLLSAGACGRPAADEIDALAWRVVEEGRAAGLSVVVFQGDQKVLVAGYGFTALQPERPACTCSRGL